MLAPIVILAAPFLTLADSQPKPTVSCTTLIDHVDPESQKNLDVFLGGGHITSDVPVYFQIPRWPVLAGEQVKFCIEDIPIPISVGDSACDDWNKCWLIIGSKAGTKPDPDDVKYCENSNDSYRGTTPCYECTCKGSYFGSGFVESNRTLTSGCGLSAQEKWGVSCPDVHNGRMVLPHTGDVGSYSNFSTAQINICSGVADDCSVCNHGGYHPQFQVGLQWASNVNQCFYEPPFTSAGIAFKTTRKFLALATLGVTPTIFGVLSVF